MTDDRPTQADLWAMFNYDPSEGFIRWRDAPYIPWRRRNQIAGHDGDRMAILIRIDGREYRAHHIAWCMVMGEWPTRQVRHKNRNKHDNRFENLYQAGIKRAAPDNSKPPWE